MCSALIHITRLTRVVYACAWRDVTDVIDVKALFDYVSTPIEKRAGTTSVVVENEKAEVVVRRWYTGLTE